MRLSHAVLRASLIRQAEHGTRHQLDLACDGQHRIRPGTGGTRRQIRTSGRQHVQLFDNPIAPQAQGPRGLVRRPGCLWGERRIKRQCRQATSKPTERCVNDHGCFQPVALAMAGLQQGPGDQGLQRVAGDAGSTARCAPGFLTLVQQAGELGLGEPAMRSDRAS